MKVHPYYFSGTKHLFDRGLALLILVLASPLILLISLIVLATSGLPIIFKQKRTGQYGKEFSLLKFRTMERNAAMLKPKYLHLNEAPWPMFKIHNDPRFVGIGKLLARTGLDELPQLWNIIKGEMSFVGPRPLPPQEANNLPLAWKQWRESVAPGIFSRWAISEEKHLSLKHWQKLEEQTMRTGSMAEDLNYLFKTPLALLVLLFKKPTAPTKSA